MTVINNQDGDNSTTIKFNSRQSIDLSSSVKVIIVSKTSNNLVEHTIPAIIEDYYYSITIPEDITSIVDDAILTVEDSNGNELFRDTIYFTSNFTESGIYKPKQSQTVQPSTSGNKYITY